MNPVDLYLRSASIFGAYVEEIGDDQWHNPTPCTEWDVRALVNHLVSENRWAPAMLASKTIAEVGDAFDGDLLGEDPKAAWRAALDEARAAITVSGSLEATVHASFGDITGEAYITQLFQDHLIHAWDLAKGIGADTTMDAELAPIAFEQMKPMIAALKASGVFGDPVELPDDAAVQARLLALTGRDPS